MYIDIKVRLATILYKNNKVNKTEKLLYTNFYFKENCN